MKFSSAPSAHSLTFDDLVGKFRAAIRAFPDTRTGHNTLFKIEDAAVGAFSVFMTQSPSFLAHQKAMELNKGKSNAQTLFGIRSIPTDATIRTLLDPVSPSLVYPVFTYAFEGLNNAGFLEPFRSINGTFLVALDATEYHSSHVIYCDQCSTKQHKNGEITYHHTAVAPALVAPGNDTVISLPPEFITPQDGKEKQDCETAAAKRWIDAHTVLLRGLGITILGDDLYSRQPMCVKILDAGWNFILVCKPDSHTTLYEWLNEFQEMGEVQCVTIQRHKGKKKFTDTYRFMIKLPIRDGADALDVNWCELTTTDQDGRVIFRNAFCTNYEITKDNVAEIVVVGRARWKIENENFNTLKTKGYNLEHNFGHGKENLSAVLLTFNILAFLFHTILGMMDTKYQMIRGKLPSRKTFFDHVRALTTYICFESWDCMLNFMMCGLELEILDSG
jgi:hypothetical protein